MNAKELTDFQLYSLVMDKNINEEVRVEVNREFENRNFTLRHLDELALKYELLEGKEMNKGLTVTQKTLIILFPFIIIFQSIITTQYLKKGNKKRWQQHWDLIALGHFFWFILILIIAKYFIFN